MFYDKIGDAITRKGTIIKMKHVVAFSHQLLQEAVTPGDIVIDATCGNGNDTVFLSRLVGENGRVLAFDIQEQAIRATKKKLTEHTLHNTDVIQDSHERVANYLEKPASIGGAIFNLGYLPGSDKRIITRGSSTIRAIGAMLHVLKKKGVIVLVIYHGHAGGAEEKDAIMHYVTTLDQQIFNVLQYGFINQRNNPPFIVAIEKK
ncbi:class I SAM-dependent methyltransferase [Lentibacillus sp. N15]|uniref:class I SAM-dependent methyltransferase n=1 Tax=Lentibacillus songyuanensis TaxID=3136161 RepID=UPI0031BBBC03